jgi:hypothetical protein
MRIYFVAKKDEPSWFQSSFLFKLSAAIGLKKKLGPEFEIFCLHGEKIEPDEDGNYRIGV